MQEQRQAGPRIPRVVPGPSGNGKQSGFDAACVAVLGRSMVATAVTEGEQHLLRYMNPAFLELAGGTDHLGLGRPLCEQFPNLAAGATRTLLARVHRSGQATSHSDAQPYSHPRRGTLFLALMAWPSMPANGLSVTLIQYLETTRPTAERDPMDELAQDLRDVNERLLVAGVREHEFAEEAERRMVVAEDAAERSESARQAAVVQTLSLAQRLITAQEAERARLARELHDDVNQQLSVLSIALTVLRHGLPESLDATRAEMDRLQQRTIHLIQTIRALSHELHPASLHGAGLPSALRHLCADAERYGDIEFRAEGDLANLPGDVSLTLYRVAQEALQNVTRHAKARHTDVVLTRDADGIQLEIKDDGRGFVNIDEHRGLGLQSMEERMLIVNGDLGIDSLPGGGTCVCARVPSASLVSRAQLVAESRAAQAAHAHASE